MSSENPDWLYDYRPSKAAAVTFTVLFAIPTFFQLYQMIRTRTWYLIALVTGGFFEAIGYIARAISSDDPAQLGPYIITVILTLVAPTLFAASVYMFLGRLMSAVGAEKLSPVRRTWLTKIFVIGDVLSFLLQCMGAGMLAQQTKSAADMGRIIIIIGLFTQLAFFGVFMMILLVFHLRLKRQGPSFTTINQQTYLPQGGQSLWGRFQEGKPAWWKYVWLLYVVSVLILIRSIFRVIEYLWKTGPLLTTEAYIYVFDAVFMVIVLVLFNVIHPSGITLRKKQANSLEMGTVSS